MAELKDIFLKRKEFDNSNPDFELPESGSLYTKYYIDTWNVIPFYGKVDKKGIAVMPKESLVRFCTYGTDKQQFSTLQPVVDYFFSLRQQYEKAYKSGFLNKASQYFKNTLAPTRAFLSPSQDYFDKMNNLKGNFFQYIFDQNKINIIKTYYDFINELIIYLKTNDKYFTRAGFVESLDYSLLHTGLAVEIFNGDTADEEQRLQFLQDINHEAFLELCVRNNMKIDREIPWRIFLDIRTKSSSIKKDDSKIILSFSNKNPTISPKIEDFIPDFGGDLNKFFDTYYDKAAPVDNNSFPFFIEFARLLQAMYTSFLAITPTYKVFSINECGKADVKKVYRQIIDINQISYQEYVKLYLQFRNAELSKVIPEDNLNYFTETAMQIFNFGQKNQDSAIAAIKYYSEAVGTLAFRNPSLYELDVELKAS